MRDGKQCKQISIDTETHGGLDILSKNTKLSLIQLEIDGKAYIIDARKIDISPLSELLENPDIRKIGQNFLFDYKVLLVKRNIVLCNLYDTMIAESILEAGISERGRALDVLALKYSNIDLDKSTRDTFYEMPYEAEFTEEQLIYAAKDVLVLPEICAKQEARMFEARLLPTAKLEFGVIPAVAEMELTGMKLDSVRWGKALEVVKRKLFKVTVDLRQQLPDPPPLPVKPPRLKKDGTPYKNNAAPKPPSVLNLDSWQQVSTSFNTIGVDLALANAITKKGITNSATISLAMRTYSGDTAKITALKNFVEFRALNHLVSSFGEGLLDHIKDDGRIHASFLQDGTQAGRFSCEKPNLEQIQKKREEGKILRSCFIPAQGNKFVIADYSQLHLRIAADLSQDPALIAIFADEHADLHKETAAQMFEIPTSQVDKQQRSIAKTINFSIIYGSGPKTLAEKIGKIGSGKLEHLCTVDEAKVFMDKYAKRFSVLMTWMKETGAQAFKNGYARTKLGRIRWFPPITEPVGSKEYTRLKSYYERVGSNHPILGMDGDMLKTAMTMLHEQLPSVSGRLVNIIHDETVIEVPANRAVDGARLLKRCMIAAGERFMSADNTGKHYVPTLVDVKIRDSWFKDDGAPDNEEGQQLWLSQDMQLMGK